jgi:hypothetical protein
MTSSRVTWEPGPGNPYRPAVARVVSAEDRIADAEAQVAALEREAEADRWATFEGTAGEYVAERYGCGGAA